MITMVMYAKIRRMFFREHLSVSEIRRRTSLSRNTIKKWLKAPAAHSAAHHFAPGHLHDELAVAPEAFA